MINREDMLELTRRMTPDRSNFVRIAGAYIDEDGYVDGTFNTNFLKLNGSEKSRCLNIAKAIPYADSNIDLVSYKIPETNGDSLWKLLYALLDCELKNDALLLNLYEIIAQELDFSDRYSIYVYYGVYDVPIKAADKERLDESEEVYKYLILAISPTDEEYNPTVPEMGILYPAFTDRSTDWEYANIYNEDGILLVFK